MEFRFFSILQYLFCSCIHIVLPLTIQSPDLEVKKFALNNYIQHYIYMKLYVYVCMLTYMCIYMQHICMQIYIFFSYAATLLPLILRLCHHPPYLFMSYYATPAAESLFTHRSHSQTSCMAIQDPLNPMLILLSWILLVLWLVIFTGFIQRPINFLCLVELLKISVSARGYAQCYYSHVIGFS